MRQSRAESLLPTAEEIRAEMAREGWSLALEPIRAMVAAMGRIQDRRNEAYLARMDAFIEEVRSAPGAADIPNVVIDDDFIRRVAESNE